MSWQGIKVVTRREFRPFADDESSFAKGLSFCAIDLSRAFSGRRHIRACSKMWLLF